MKNIEVPDEMYDQLMELATEYMTQDNRITAKPYLFQLRTTHQVAAYEGCGEEIWIDDEGDEWTDEERIGLINSFQKGKYGDNAPLYDDLDDWDRDGVMSDMGHRKVCITKEHRYENGFFTAKGCEEHIRINGHNLNHPVDTYLTHAFRNAEMDLMADLFEQLHNTKEK